MMLSENLQCLMDHLAEYRDTGLEMEPEGVEGFCAVLSQAVDDARALEACAVAELFPPGRSSNGGSAAGTNVVAFPRRGGGR